MKVTFTIDDDLFEFYNNEAKQRRMSPADVLNERLKRAIGLDPRERAIILTGGRVMSLVEEKLGGGNLKNAEDLLRKVTALASIRFGEHEFKITPGQWREIAFRATKMHLTPEQVVERMYTEMQKTFFAYVP